MEEPEACVGEVAGGGAGMTSTIATVLCGGPHPSLTMEGTFDRWEISTYDNRDNLISPCAAYQKLLESCDTDVIVYLHDDVEICDPKWLPKVLEPFLMPEVVAVGLGGATGLGNKDLYRKPFNIWNMARYGYASNQEDAEVHGERFCGSKRVAVLDAFFMAIRVDFLRSIGGWPVDCLTHHCLDLWLACEAARYSRETWITGLKCNHYGGRSSTAPEYAKASWLQGGSMEQDHILPHQWIYENYRDVLPIEV